jgi:glycosyltransferase involved in cell wall biosynthesis
MSCSSGSQWGCPVRSGKLSDWGRSVGGLLQRKKPQPHIISPGLLVPVPGLLPPGKRLIIFFWPDYTKTNPYQTLLNGAPGSEYEFRTGNINTASEYLNAHNNDEKIVFHLHWISGVIKPKDSPAEAAASSGEFLDALTSFVDRGGKLVWTIHNVISHDTPHTELEIKLCRAVSALASVIHVHGHQALADAAAVFPIDRDKVVIAEHGSYIGAYPDVVSRKRARKRLRISERSIVFTHFGLIRPYKGFDLFLKNLSEIELPPDAHPPVALIAGRPLRLSDKEVRRAARRRLKTIFHLGHVDTADVQTYMRASDFLVLPYRKVLTSGTAILSLSFGVPVIAPRSGLVPEIVEHGRSGLLYDPDDHDGLARSLTAALSMHMEDRARMGDNARHKAETMRWAETRKLLLKAVVDTCFPPDVKRG